MRLFVVATLVLSIVQAKPFVHSQVRRLLLQEGEDESVAESQADKTARTIGLFVSFETPDLSAAMDPQRLAQRLSGFHGPQQAMSPDEYHRKRGDFVHDTLRIAHERTKDVLTLHDIPYDRAFGLPISNSFLIPHADRAVLARLLQVPGLTEVVTANGHRMQLPRPKSHSPIPHAKSIFDQDAEEAAESTNADERADEDMQWNVRQIGMADVWREFGDAGQGKHIVYGIADTGTAFKHPNLQANYVGLRGKDSHGNPVYDHNYAWYDGVRTPIGPLGTVARQSQSVCPVAGREPCDDQGHGTHVASIAVGADGFGVAPKARWIACRNMDAGVGAPQAYLACLNFFLAPHDLDGQNARPDLRPHAVGNSYGCPDSEGCSPRALKAAVEALRAAGVFMSVSAGNEGPGCGTVAAPPAVEPAIIAVAATNSRDELARFSSRGPVSIDGQAWAKPDVSAPGVAVRAAFPPNDYRSLSGTSMAAPHVGGAAAVLMSACPCLERNVDDLQTLLQATAVHLKPPANASPLCGNDTPDSIPNNYFGYGRINVLDAVRACRKRCSQQKLLLSE